MSWQTLYYLVPYIVSLGISTGVGIYALRRRHVTGAKPFAIAALSQASWTFGYIFELLSPSLEAKIFWDNFQFLGLFGWPLAFFAFALQYTDRRLTYARHIWVVNWTLVAAYLLFIFTDSFHGLIRPDARLIPGEPFSALVYDFTIQIWIGFIYFTLLFLSSLYLLLVKYIRPHRLYRAQVGAIIVGTLIPLIGLTLTVFGITFTFHRDISPFTFAASNMIIAWGLFRYRLFDVLPVARDMVIDSMSDSVIVVDAHNRIVDLNPAAEEVIGRKASEVIGKPTSEIYSNWPDLVEKYQNVEEAHEEIVVDAEDGKRYVELRLMPLHDRQNRLLGRLLVLRDISEQRRAEEALRKAHDELELRVEERTRELVKATDDLKQEIRDREKAEEALRDSEVRNRAIVEALPDLMFRQTRDGTYIEYRAPSDDLLFAPPDKIVGSNIGDLGFPPDFVDQSLNLISKALDTNSMQSLEYQLELPKGIGEFEVRIVPCGEEEILAIVRDITDRKRIDEITLIQRDLGIALSAATGLEGAQELCLDAAIRISEMDSGGVYILDDISGNLNLCCHKGLSTDFIENASHYEADSPNAGVIMAGNPVYAIYDDLEVPLPEEHIREGLRAVAVIPMKHEGKVIGCLNIASHKLIRVPMETRNALETIVAQMGSAIVRVKAKDALEESESRYRLLAENATDVIWAMDMNLGYTYISPSVEELRGITVEEAMTQTLDEMLTPESFETVMKIFENEFGSLESGNNNLDRIRTFEAEVKHRDGSTVWTESTTKFLADENGKPKGILGVTRNITHRKQAEEALRESEEKFSKAFHASPVLMALIDMETRRYIDLNETALSIMGFSREEVVGKTPEEMTSVIDPEERNEMLKTLLEKGRFRDWETKLMTKSGQIRTGLLSSELIEIGNRKCVLNVMGDITDRKLAEEALREREDLYRTLFENAGDAIFIMKGELFQECNQKTLEMFGCEREEIIGCHPADFSSPIQPDGRDSMEKAKEKIAAAYNIGPQFFEWKHTRHDGTPFDAETSLNLVELGTGVHLQAIVRDITDRKQAEEALQREQAETLRLKAFLESVLDNIMTGIVVTDNDGKVMIINPEGQEILGAIEQDSIGRPIEEMSSDLKPFKEIVQPSDAGREISVKLAKGMVIPLGFNSSYLLDAEGNKSGVITVFRDLTEIKELQKELKNKEKLATIGEMARGIAHEIKNPLFSISGSLQVLERRTKDITGAESSSESLFSILFSETERINRLVSALGFFGKDRKPVFEKANLAELLEYVLVANAGLISKKKLSIKKKLSSKSIIIDADRDKLLQVFENILQNAIAFSPQKGRVYISTKTVEKGSKAKIEIGDEGPGIPEDDLDKIFNLFYSTRERGSGLGLAISKQIVYLHGGTIVARKREGGGASFEITVLKRQKTNEKK